MEKYLLIWTDINYHEMDGGTRFEKHESVCSLEKRINDIERDHNGNYVIDFVGEIMRELKLTTDKTDIRIER